jgi:flavin-dependent dehydrogenase
MRDAFDAAIVEEARRLGADVRDGLAFEGLQRAGEGWIVRAGGRAFEGHRLIAADGVRSAVRRALGLGPVLRRGAAIEAELAATPAELRRVRRTILFDFGGVPWGYAWTFPKRAHLSVGILSFEPRGSDLRRAFEAYLGRVGLRDREGPREGWELPAGPDDGPFHADGAMLVGDAAGLVDPLTGEGIHYAVLSGKIAAEAAAEGAPPSAYTDRVRREIVSELSVARRLADFFYAHPRLSYFAGVRSRRANAAMMDALCGDRSYADARRALKRSWWAMLV